MGNSFGRSLTLLIVALILGGLLLAGAYGCFLKLTGQWEIQKLQLQAELARLEMEEERARADRLRADGEKTLAEGQAEIFEANARLLNRMSAVLSFWLALLPLAVGGLVLTVGGLGAFAGVMLVLTIGIALYFRFEQRYVPFIETSQNVK
jgi:outer membrane murein-binding lipoprotein Lpp